MSAFSSVQIRLLTTAEPCSGRASRPAARARALCPADRPLRTPAGLTRLGLRGWTGGRGFWLLLLLSAHCSGKGFVRLSLDRYDYTMDGTTESST